LSGFSGLSGSFGSMFSPFRLPKKPKFLSAIRVGNFKPGLN
jgi:hypothetical protein